LCTAVRVPTINLNGLAAIADPAEIFRHMGAHIDPNDSFRFSGADWKKAILTDAYQKKDILKRVEHNIQPVLGELSRAGARRDAAEWLDYLAVYFANMTLTVTPYFAHDGLVAYFEDKFHRKAKRTKKMMRDSRLDSLKHAMFTPGAPLAPLRRINPHNHAYVRPQEPDQDAWINKERVQRPGAPQTDTNWPPVIVWGGARFGNRRGHHPLPVKLLQEYIGRFALVILLPEHMTSQQCPCTDAPGSRTVQYTLDGYTCDHVKRECFVSDPNLDGDPPDTPRIKGWRRRVKFCFDRVRDEHGRVKGLQRADWSPLNPHGRYHECVHSQQERRLTVVRHRVCPHCR
jgi:hypothetical protein